jgi:succinate dehydrogenase/fumarate reductase flavoprotein subunit
MLLLWLPLACVDPKGDSGGSAATGVDGETGIDRETGDSGGSSTLPDVAPVAEVDVLVVGSGAGGLGAAWAAREAGASVWLVERDHSPGGASNSASNYWAAGTPNQASAGVVDSPESALAEWADFTGGDASDPVVVEFVEGSAGVITWLESFGVRFWLGDQVPEDTGSVRRMHGVEQAGGPAPVTVAATLADVIQYGMTATELVLDGPAVAGLWVETDVGERLWIRAGATVLATGGFTRNDALVFAFVPELAEEETWYESHPGMDGNGLTLAAEAGATTQNMDHLGLYAHAIEDAKLGRPEVMVVGGLEYTVIVDGAGERVDDERRFGSVSMGRRYLDEGPFYAVFDDDLWSSTSIQGRGFNYEGDPDGLQLTGPDYAAKHVVAEGDDGIALAAALGLDGARLQATLDAYNADAVAGVDTRFGKPDPWFVPLDTAPYHAVPLVLGRSKSFGGLETDARGAVLDSRGEPIAGLFAAGEVCGFLGTPGIGYGLNGSITAVWWSGLRAGASAAAP